MSILTSPALRYPKSLWSYNPIPNGCVLYLPLWNNSLSGPVFKSPDPFGHTATVTSAVWGPTGRTFDGDDDYITTPATVTNFTTENFSFFVRLYPHSLAALFYILSRGVNNTYGYEWFVATNGAMTFRTNQVSASQTTVSDVGSVTINTWQTLGMSRDGDAITIFVNGIDKTATPGEHINPKTNTIVDMFLGVNYLLNFDFDGIYQSMFAYNSALSEAEHLHIHNTLQWRT